MLVHEHLRAIFPAMLQIGRDLRLFAALPPRSLPVRLTPLDKNHREKAHHQASRQAARKGAHDLEERISRIVMA